MKSLSNQYRNFLLNLSGVLTASLFFASGIGSYRIFLIYAFQCLLRALNIEQILIFIFLPAYIVTFYLDATNGPIFVHASRINFVIALALFVIADTLVHNLFKKLISKITQNQYFVECPSCHFNNIQLVEACANCSYRKGLPRSPVAAKISPFIKGDKIPPGLINLLTMSEGEEILFHKRLTLFSQQLKNGNRVVRKHFVITNRNLIILDYLSFHIHIPKSWRERDVIPVSEIVSVEGKMKKFIKAVRPFLIVKTVNKDVYEIVLSTFGNYIDDTNEIAAIITKINGQVKITVELTETPLKKILNTFSHLGN